MTSPEEDRAYGLLQEYANGFMVSQVRRRGHGGPLGAVSPPTDPVSE